MLIHRSLRMSCTKRFDACCSAKSQGLACSSKSIDVSHFELCVDAAAWHIDAQTAHRRAPGNYDYLGHPASLTVGTANEKQACLANAPINSTNRHHNLAYGQGEDGDQSRPSRLRMKITSRRVEIAEAILFWRNEPPHLLSGTRFIGTAVASPPRAVVALANRRPRFDAPICADRPGGAERLGPRRASPHAARAPQKGNLAKPQTASLQRRVGGARHLERGDEPRSSAFSLPLSEAGRDNRDFTGAAACRMMA